MSAAVMRLLDNAFGFIEGLGDVLLDFTVVDWAVVVGCGVAGGLIAVGVVGLVWCGG